MSIRKSVVVLACCIVPATGAAAQQYFVSPTGSDAADGLTPQTAWRSVAKVNQTPLSAGATVLFERGGEWRERLVANASGTETAPITYASYGEGAKPKFWGSDPLNSAGFTKVPGTTSTYAIAASGTAINSVLSDHSFLSSARLRTNNGSTTVQRDFVNANANTWAHDGQTLYVNTGGVAPTSSQFTVAVRDDVVDSNAQSNLVFRDLVVDESAKYDAGYAFRIQGSDNVTLDNVEAYRAGKHHVGVINSGNFVGRGIKAALAMPDQGYGGATAFVAYSDHNRTADNSHWIDCTVEQMGGIYPAFYTHGTGVGDITLTNLTSRGASIALGTEGQNQNVRIDGGLLEDSQLLLYGDEIIVNGLRVDGDTSSIMMLGRDNLVQNVLMTGLKPDRGYYAAIEDRGSGNTVQFSTIVLDPDAPGHATALALINPAGDTVFRGNVYSGPFFMRQWFAGSPNVLSDYNMLPPGSPIVLSNGVALTLAQWQSMGFDEHSLAALAQFVDPANGDYSLVPGSPAITSIPLDWLNGGPPRGAGFDPLVPEPSLGVGALVAVAALAAGRRRRSR